MVLQVIHVSILDVCRWLVGAGIRPLLVIVGTHAYDTGTVLNERSVSIGTLEFTDDRSQ